MNRLIYMTKNWKMGIHLVFRTKRFGVNNKWRNDFDSIWGWNILKILWSVIIVKPIINNFKSMRTRATYLHFLSNTEKEKMGWQNLPQH